MTGVHTTQYQDMMRRATTLRFQKEPTNILQTNFASTRLFLPSDAMHPQY